ncbi:MAG: putative metal-binding motif-containing protein [Myxococcales bacterium]|nr:putative metal-binding motif-containing protein [Myxococcales bacterium]
MGPMRPRPVARALALSVVIAGAGLAAVSGCGSSSVPSPFKEDAGADVDAAEGGGDSADVIDPLLGPPCVDDPQCDDGIDCTFDACDQTLGRCRFTPDDSTCQDSVFCDGLEVCDPKLGCREGTAIACDDNATCTIDTCIEASKSCINEARDVDGDGDPDWSCGGSDCNDTDPAVSGKQSEICGNSADDDCDGAVDEAGCVSPKYDKCADALKIEKSGQYVMSLTAAASDYAASCATSGAADRDVVAAIIVPPGPAMDVDVIATAGAGTLALASVAQCGVAGTETACGAGYSLEKGGVMARVRLRSLSPGAHPLYVFGQAGNVTLKVSYQPASTQPTNETCGTALPVVPGVSVKASVIDAVEDLSSVCDAPLGELTYEVTLTEPRDVHVWATSLDGLGKPAVALWQPDCSDKKQELGCNVATQAHVFERALPAGKYVVALSATVPSDLDLLVELFPPTAEPADETCASGAVLVANQSVAVPLSGHTDDVSLGCMAGAIDAVYSLDLPVASDVLLVGRISDNDTGGVSLVKPACATKSDTIVCGVSPQTPVRARAHKVAAGSYRVVIETTNAAPTILSAFTRPQTPPILVPFADTCATAVKVPPAGGFFQGNTANANADYDAGCDLGSQGPGGAPEQMLRLDLTKKKRVVLDMKGSAYSTLLVVRRAEGCPGPEVTKACAAGYYPDKSFLDLTLDAGSYFVQVDGYAGNSGQWFLDVFVVDP